jgi:hypothetical protein
MYMVIQLSLRDVKEIQAVRYLYYSALRFLVAESRYLLYREFYLDSNLLLLTESL